MPSVAASLRRWHATTIFVQSGQQTIADYTSGTAATCRRTATSTPATSTNRCCVRGTGGLLYYHRNQQYSITALTNGGGTIVERYAYTAYGTPTITDGKRNGRTSAADNNRYTYTGREWDEELGLYHYRARMYDSYSDDSAPRRIRSGMREARRRSGTTNRKRYFQRDRTHLFRRNHRLCRCARCVDVLRRRLSQRDRSRGMELLREHFVNVRRVLLADPNIDCDPFDGLELLRINFPNGVSVNEYALQNASVDDALGKRIRAASWISGTPSQVECSETDQPNANTKTLVERSEASPQPTAASPTPAIIDDVQVERSETEVTLTIESRRWRIRSLERNTTIGVLKVNVMVFNDRNDRFHVDTLDLYHARSRRVFLKEAGEEIAVNEHELRSDLGRVLLKLEQLQQDLLKKGKPTAPKVEITDVERSEAMGLLKDERLLDRILDDFDACGIVGERIGKLTGYLAATSRLLPKPLGVVIQSSSAAGKTSLSSMPSLPSCRRKHSSAAAR